MKTGTTWNVVKSQDSWGDWFEEGWFFHFEISEWSLSINWRCCIAKYDSQPYFLFVFGFVYFAIGKYFNWD